ncbi:hypothetical protein CcaCcLH18_00027 [Colletotrichum camelliae]|nr:hypothetical protein CcaCcLH18_00027 [Colletotrichum camelliae]
MATNAADAGEEKKISLVVEFSCVPLSCPSFHNAALFQKPFLPRGRFCLRPCHEDDSDTDLIWNRACMLPSGGLEMLFSDERRHSLSIPAVNKDGKPANIAFLIDYLCENTMKDTRKELFVLDGHLRPGILALINDADWELEGEEAYEVQSGDNILFVSTLHGG